jgi:hypothetical protein
MSEYRPLYSFTEAVRCRIHCRATNMGMEQWNLNSTISVGVECRWRRR